MAPGSLWLHVLPSATESLPEAEQMALSSLKLELAALEAVSKIKEPALGILSYQQEN